MMPKLIQKLLSYKREDSEAEKNKLILCQVTKKNIAIYPNFKHLWPIEKDII